MTTMLIERAFGLATHEPPPEPFPWWKFCGPRVCANGLIDRPIAIDGVTYATDGRVIIRVPEVVEVATAERGHRRLLDTVLNQFAAIDREWIDPDAWQRIEPVREQDLTLDHWGIGGCPGCAGRGDVRISMDPAEEITCPECGGSCQRIPDGRFVVQIGPLHFDAHYIRLLSSLPGCEWRETDPDRRHEAPIHFRWFSEYEHDMPQVGDGLLMPLAWGKLTTSERRNITQPADWWAAIEAAAAAESVTVSEWIGEACRKRLPVSVRRGLSVRPGAHRPKKPDVDSVSG